MNQNLSVHSCPPREIKETDLLQNMILLKKSVIQIKGKEAQAFLQRIVTQDLRGLKKEKAVYSALLTPQGKLVCDFFLYAPSDPASLKTDLQQTLTEPVKSEQTSPGQNSLEQAEPEFETLLIIVSETAASELVKTLKFYRLRLPLQIELLPLYVVALMPDREISSPLKQKEALNVKKESFNPVCFEDPRLAGFALYFLLAKQDKAQITNRLEDQEYYENYRLLQGLIDPREDLPDTMTLYPSDINLDLLGAISFKKGCFIGQEVVSRIQRRSLVRKRVLPFHLISKISPSAQNRLAMAFTTDSSWKIQIYANGNPVGKCIYLTSKQPPQSVLKGFGLLRLDRLAEEEKKQLIKFEILFISGEKSEIIESYEIKLLKPEWWEKRRQER